MRLVTPFKSTTMELIKLEPTTNAKEIGRAMVESICHDVAEGNINPLKQLIVLKSLENAIDEIRQNILDQGIEEVRKYGKETDMNGYKISIINAGAKYDYSNCNHPVYNELSKKAAEIKAELTEIEKFLKSLKAPLDMLDKETGEIYTIYPPVYSSKETLKFQ